MLSMYGVKMCDMHGLHGSVPFLYVSVRFSCTVCTVLPLGEPQSVQNRSIRRRETGKLFSNVTVNSTARAVPGAPARQHTDVCYQASAQAPQCLLA